MQKELEQEEQGQEKLKQTELEELEQEKQTELGQEKLKQEKKQKEKKFQIRFTVLNFTLLMLENVILPERKEVVLRGGIGDMLLKQYCVRNAKCEECDFTNSCLVQNFMYAKYKKKPDFVTTGESMGYVLSAEGKKTYYRAGERLRFSLTLFGDVIAYLNPIVQTVYLLGRYGIGEDRASYEVERIQNRQGKEILKNGSIYYKNYLIEILEDYVEERKQQLKEIDSEKGRRIFFSSPLSLKYKSQFLREFDICAILNGVARRVYMLECFEGRESTEKKFFENFPVILEQNTIICDAQRYSSRTKKYMPLKGIAGEVLLDRIEGEMLDYLLAGEVMHIGKNTRFGFGKYRVI